MKYSSRHNGHFRQDGRANGQGVLASISRERPSTVQAETVVAALKSILRDMFIVDDATSDLPLRQLRVCAFLAEGPRSMSALSRELGVSLSAITQIADRLVAAGLAERVAEEADRRVRCLQLTIQGRQIMQRRQQIKIRRAQAALQHISRGDQKKLLASLANLKHACQEIRRT